MTAVGESALQRILRDLEGFGDLPADWDGYGAAPIEGTAIAGAHGLIESVCAGSSPGSDPMAPYDVAPIADGGVQVEWRGGSRELQVEVHRDGTLGYLLIQRAMGKPVYTEVEIAAREAVKALATEVATAPHGA